MKYTLGLDIGTSSVGWAVINNNKNRIEDLGVRLFESAENQKDGESLAKPRRDARSMRRRLARRGYRLEKIKAVFEETKLLTKEQITEVHSHPNNPYEIRAKGLDKLLTPEELFIAIYHLAKRRGYKSNRKKIDAELLKDDKKDKDIKVSEEKKEVKAVLGGINENEKLLKTGGFRTVGEMLYAQMPKEKEKSGLFVGVRNRPGSYKHSVSREMLGYETEQILEAQRKLGNNNVTDDFISFIVGKNERGDGIGAFNFQRPFSQGSDLEKLVGFCTFEKKERRAAKATYSFQYFNFLQKLNHLRIENPNGVRSLTEEERRVVIDKALGQKDITYEQIKKWLKLNKEDRFNITYAVSRRELEAKSIEDLKDAFEKNEKFPSMKDYYDLRKKIESANKEFWDSIKNDVGIIDAIAEILTLYKTDGDIIDHLRETSFQGRTKFFPESVENALLGLSFKKFGHLSLVALKKIIPYLEEGITYDKAVEKADPVYGKNLKTRTKKLLPLQKDDHQITNPVVRRSISQTIKVVNAIIDKFGAPTEVHLELGRELAKDHKERMKDMKRQRENTDRNEGAAQKIAELKIPGNGGQDIIKYKLWEEQGNKCAYSGGYIEPERLFEHGYTEIDHIVPFSRSFDDSYNNKVLVLKKENQEKGNRIPYEVFGGDLDAWARFENIVNSMKISPRKKQNLLLKKYTGGDITTRSLNDTRFASRFLKNYIADTLLFAEEGPKQKVVTVNGQATAYLRKRWGLNKDREENNRHHAQDAVVVAVTTQGLIQRVMRSSKMGEIVDYLHAHKDAKIIDPETGKEFDDEIKREVQDRYIAHHERRRKFEEPWAGFTKELEARMSDEPAERLKLLQHTVGLSGYPETEEMNFVRPIFSSRMPRHKITGRAHQETLRSPKRFSNEESVVRKPLTSVNLKTLEDMSGKESDYKLYEVLKARLLAHGDDPKKAFAEPLHKPMKDGTDGPIVRSIKMVSGGQRSGLLVNNGNALVDQDTMVRIDIFSKSNARGKRQFYIIPVYAYHFAKGVLPDKVIIGGSEKDWEKIDESYLFEFSLYPNDLVKIIREGKEIFGYYDGCDRTNASIHILPHDQIKPLRSNGVKTLDKVEKYCIDILGNYHLVRGEKRQGIKK